MLLVSTHVIWCQGGAAQGATSVTSPPAPASMLTEPSDTSTSTVVADQKAKSVELSVSNQKSVDSLSLEYQIEKMNRQTLDVQRIKAQEAQEARGLRSIPAQAPHGFIGQDGRIYGNQEGEDPHSTLVPRDQSPTLICDSLRLTLTFKSPPAIALSNILGAYWLFFDHPYDIEMPKRLPQGIDRIENFSTPFNTIFKMTLEPGYWPNLRAQSSVSTASTPDQASSQGQLVIECSTNPWVQRQKKMITWPNTLDGAIKILAPKYTKEISWYHPDLKTPIMIYLSKRHEGTFTPQETYPYFKIYESYIGLSLSPYSDALVMTKEGEDLYLYNARGLTAHEHPYTYPASTLFLNDPRPPQFIHQELQEIRHNKASSQTLLHDIRLCLSLGFFGEASLNIQNLHDARVKGEYHDQGELDLMTVVLLALSPNDDLETLKKDYLNHEQQSPEFEFWKNLYKRRPQNYAHLVGPMLSQYSVFLRNKITEILLTLPDSYNNLNTLIQMKGLDNNLLERARLKLALMAPFDLQELEHLKDTSTQRDVQAQATLQLIISQKEAWKDFEKSGKIDAARQRQEREQAIKDLEDFLLSFSSNMFQAKMLLAQLYEEKKDYVKAMTILRDLVHSDPDRFEDTQKAMQETYVSFFDDLGSPCLLERLQKRVCPMSEPVQNLAYQGKQQQPLIKPHPLVVVGFFNDYKILTPEGPKSIDIIEHVATELMNLSLFDSAIELLNKKIESILEATQPVHETPSVEAASARSLDASHLTSPKPLQEDQSVVRLRTIVTLLALLKGDFELAQKYQGSALPIVDHANSFDQCMALSIERGLNHLDQALDMLKQHRDPQSLDIRAHIYWDMKDWLNLQRLIPYMLQHMSELSPDMKVNLILKLCVARAMAPLKMSDVRLLSSTQAKQEGDFESLLLSQRPLSEEDLRQEYSSFMKTTPHNDEFLALTTPDLSIEEGLVRFNTLKPLLDTPWL